MLGGTVFSHSKKLMGSNPPESTALCGMCSLSVGSVWLQLSPPPTKTRIRGQLMTNLPVVMTVNVFCLSFSMWPCNELATCLGLNLASCPMPSGIASSPLATLQMITAYRNRWTEKESTPLFATPGISPFITHHRWYSLVLVVPDSIPFVSDNVEVHRVSMHVAVQHVQTGTFLLVAVAWIVCVTRRGRNALLLYILPVGKARWRGANHMLFPWQQRRADPAPRAP